MILGIAYAQFVAATIGLGTLLPQGGLPTADGMDRWRIALGANVAPTPGPGEDGFLTVDRLFGEPVWRELRPFMGFGISVDGAVFATVGLYREFRVGNLTITPYFGPTIYQSDLGGAFQSEELLQFRTGVEVSYSFSEQMRAGVGIYHISNAGITPASADIDVAYASVLFRF
jgi:hypothetical protein